MRIALIPLNPTVGAIDDNVTLAYNAIERACEQATGTGDGVPVDVCVLPELAICGYPPRDLLQRHGFVDRCVGGACVLASRVAERWPEMTLVVGTVFNAPGGHGKRNSLLVYRTGRDIARYDKCLLPTYDVFDEDRYFDSGETPCVVDVRGTRIGLAICEDLWRGDDVGFASRYRDRADPIVQTAQYPGGVDVVIVPSASPFVMGKDRSHRAILERAAAKIGKPVLSINQLGGNDDLVFDGRAEVVEANATIAAQNTPFSGDTLVVDVGPVRITHVCGHRTDTAESENDDDVRLVVDALTLGVRDYLGKCRFKTACLGLSGGIDSALTAAIAVRALGADAVTGVSMPGPYSSAGSVTDAEALAANLGMRCIRMPIGAAYNGHKVILDDAFAAIDEHALGSSMPDLTQENLQSRVRGALMMALSNRTGAILLTTGNKSELAVGYCTLYGDMNGGLAVLSDVSKTLVFEICRALNDRYASFGFAAPPIPESTISKPPSAELAPDQLDSHSLPDYAVLDTIVHRYVERQQSVNAIIDDTDFDADLVRRICRLIDLNEYKRRQLAVGLKVTGIAFGPGRRMPIAQGFRY